ncbi:hypothetical protein SAMN02787144_102122 [Streptomyces atratus]|uniref:Uncharacterized protein n=1 Tax=Streptomyces atratus TaxID=1893 RepID=A0A1K2EQ61_STRAR|nr:hypothetical protein SAMN02787144_102122 [Streptomyces atratus]
MHPGKRKRKNASAMKLVGKLVAVFRRAAGLTQTPAEVRTAFRIASPPG